MELKQKGLQESSGKLLLLLSSITGRKIHDQNTWSWSRFFEGNKYFFSFFFSSSELNFRHEAGGLGRCPVSQCFIRRLAGRKLNSFSHSMLIVFTNVFICGGFWGEPGAYERPKQSHRDCFLSGDNEFVRDRTLAWAVRWSKINTYVNNNNESVIIPALEK